MQFFALLFLSLLATFSIAQPGEVKFLSSIYNDSSSLKVSTAKYFSSSVAPISAAVPAGILITGLIKKDSTLIEKGVQASVAFAFNAIVTTCLKYQADKRRPFVTYPDLFRSKTPFCTKIAKVARTAE